MPADETQHTKRPSRGTLAQFRKKQKVSLDTNYGTEVVIPVVEHKYGYIHAARVVPPSTY